MNKVILRGHLGADVVLNRTNTSQKAVCNFRMATNKVYTDAAGNKVKNAEWHNVVCWERLAETVAQYCHKGSNVLVEGEIKTREFLGKTQYENGQDVVDGAGNPIMVKRYTTEIIARNVEFLDKAPSTQAYPGVAQPGVPVAAAPGVATQFVVAPPANPAVVPATGYAAPAVAPVAPAVAPVYAAAPVAPVAEVVQPVVIPGAPVPPAGV